jgi:hypothetical protein
MKLKYILGILAITAITGTNAAHARERSPSADAHAAKAEIRQQMVDQDRMLAENSRRQPRTIEDQDNWQTPEELLENQPLGAKKRILKLKKSVE